MEQAEQRLVQLARSLAALALRVAKTYDDEQRRLSLDQLLTVARLSTAEGTSQSLEQLALLRKLTATHKEVFGRWIVSASGQLSAALADVSEEKREYYARDCTTALNRQLKVQMEFYVGRERWIDAAEGICRLLDACRESCSFDEGLRFQEAEDLERFQELTAVVDEVHRAEVKLFMERTQRIAASFALLDQLGSQ